MKICILFLGIEPRGKASKVKMIAGLLVGFVSVILLVIVVRVTVYKHRKYEPNVILLSSADEERSSFEVCKLTKDDKCNDQEF